MKKYLLVIGIAILLSVGAGAQDVSVEMGKLVFMSGCWRRVDPIQILDEQWSRPAGQSLFGVGRTIKDGQTVFYEFLQIRQRSDGIFYIAQANEEKPVSFKLVKVNDTQAIFENPQYEFPQRIIYERAIDGSLRVSLDGIESGKPKKVDFAMKRMRCD